MAHGPQTSGQLAMPHIRGRYLAKLLGATCWFFVFFRMYHDGGHHFLNKHPWEEPQVLEYLEKVDEKYGTRLSKDNLHSHHH